MVSIEGGRSCLYQWDINQRLRVDHPEVTEVHFSNTPTQPALICEVYDEGGVRYADIPNILLQQPLALRAHGCCEECVHVELIIRVVARAKPADYVYTETEVRSFENLMHRAEEAVQVAEAAAAEAKETLESIPEDYTELAREVSGISKEIGYTTTRVDVPIIWIDGYFVNQWGNTTAYAGCKIARITDATHYVGKTLRCKSYAFGDMAYIVQSADWVTLAKGTSGNTLSSEGNWAFEFTVPDGANWIQVSYCETYGSGFELYYEETGSTLKKKVDMLADEALAENPLSVIRRDPGLLSVFLTVGCVGDSLSSGCCVYKDTNGVERGIDLYQYSWGQYLARMTGNTYYNFSRGGWSTKDWLDGDYGAALAFDGEHTCDAYIIGLGQNDNNQKITVGTSADINITDYTRNADTFYGYYGEIIQRIQSIQPRAKIFICTDPLVKADSPETNGYNAAIRQIATMFDNVYLLDLYEYGRDLYDYDGTNLLSINKRYAHFNAVGYYLCALINATYIDWIMRTRPEDFREVEYIGTDLSYYE